MTTSIPFSENLVYNSAKPLGYPSEIHITRFDPGGNLYYIGNDYIRIVVRSKGFWDPYSTYLNIELDFSNDPPTNAGCTYQLDHSASSVISRLRILQGNVEVERIEEYDTLVATLNDFSFDESGLQSRRMQGFGSGTKNFTNYTKAYPLPMLFQPYGTNLNGSNVTSGTGTNLLNGTNIRFPVAFPALGSAVNAFFSNGATQIVSNSITNVTGTNNLVLFNYNTSPTLNANVVMYLYWTNAISTISGQVIEQNTPLGYIVINPSTYTTASLYPIVLLSSTSVSEWANSETIFGSTFGFNPLFQNFFSTTGTVSPFSVGQFNAQAFSTMANGSAGFKYNMLDRVENNIDMWDQIAYLGYGKNGLSSTSAIGHNNIISDIGYKDIPSNNNIGIGNTVITPNLTATQWSSSEFYTGLSKPFDPALCGTCFEPRFSNSQNGMNVKLGNPSDVLANKYKANFKVPLFSGMFGALMPKESYKLIPLEAFNDLLFEFTVSPYAVFTSGNNDTVNTSTNASLQYQRFFRVSYMEIITEIANFSEDVNNLVSAQLNTDDGIVFHTCSWVWGLTTPFTNNSVNGNITVNVGLESMKSLLFLFLDTSFIQFSYCRKQYRLSQNLTSVNIKVGTKYYPDQAILGHGGNSTYYENVSLPGNVSEFLVNTQKALGKFLQTDASMIVNDTNFAVNRRIWNPSNFNNPLASLYALPNDTFVQNPNTAYGLPLFWENKCVGKAVYGIDLEVLNNDFTFINGVNTIPYKPFELVLKNDTQSNQLPGAPNSYWPTNEVYGPFTGTANLYVFCYYDMMVQINKQRIQVLGRTG